MPNYRVTRFINDMQYWVESGSVCLVGRLRWTPDITRAHIFDTYKWARSVQMKAIRTLNLESEEAIVERLD